MAKGKTKKQAHATVDYSKVIGCTLAGIGVIIIVLLVVILAKTLRDEKKYTIAYHSDDRLAEEIVERSELDSEVIVEPENKAEIADTTEYIKVERALEIALESAGLKKENVWDIDIELERKFGQMVFEVSFDAGQYEYEYYINAKSGEIVKSFRELD